MPLSSARRIIGIGSHIGDDQVGRLLAARLQLREWMDADVLVVESPLEILDVIGNCHQLVIIDACLTGAPVGTITRLEWPDPRIESHWGGSTHQLGVSETLQLGQQLGRLPERVSLFGIEIGNAEPALSVSRLLEDAMSEVERRICLELDCENTPSGNVEELKTKGIETVEP